VVTRWLWPVYGHALAKKVRANTFGQTARRTNLLQKHLQQASFVVLWIIQPYASPQPIREQISRCWAQPLSHWYDHLLEGGGALGFHLKILFLRPPLATILIPWRPCNSALRHATAGQPPAQAT
jgi:hypothetical protein